MMDCDLQLCSAKEQILRSGWRQELKKKERKETADLFFSPEEFDWRESFLRDKIFLDIGNWYFGETENDREARRWKIKEYIIGGRFEGGCERGFEWVKATLRHPSVYSYMPDIWYVLQQALAWCPYLFHHHTFYPITYSHNKGLSFRLLSQKCLTTLYFRWFRIAKANKSFDEGSRILFFANNDFFYLNCFPLRVVNEKMPFLVFQ